ncbi:MAG: PspC domain-containing protein [Thermoleophilaceae bacterium]
MTSRPAPSDTGVMALRRDRERRIIGGVCAGVAKQLGVDPVVVRIAFIVLALAGGIGAGLYALLWLFVPAEDGSGLISARGLAGRGGLEVALGVAFLLLALLLTFRALGVWWSDAVVWPLVLVAGGAALLWREASAHPDPAGAEADLGETPAGPASRSGLGVALVVGAGLAFLGATGALSAARDVLLSVLVVALVLGVIFAPWIVRLARSLATERAERIRSEERAEMAAHLHDSVLQTLALVQQRAGDAPAVAALARRQERELRAWLGERAAPGVDATLAAALQDVAGEVERDHGVRVEVVTVGDAPLDDRAGALVAAAREAVVNAAKFGGGSPVDVFAEVGDDDLQVYVRDRGPGFDPDELAPDRRGVRESIVGRMQRHGGRAAIASRPGEGTEVELTLPRIQ